MTKLLMTVLLVTSVCALLGAFLPAADARLAPCPANVGDCRGDCLVNVGYCERGARCTVNVGDCRSYCLVSVGTCAGDDVQVWIQYVLA